MKTKIVAIALLSTLFYPAYLQDIKLVVRADDMGFCRSANLATIQAYQEGIVTSAEVISAAPWFLDAVRMLNENPGLDAGVHLTLTSEWNNMKWGPLSSATTLITEDGYFPATTDEMKALNKDPDEIRAEFEAQINIALKYIPQLTHISTHMFNPQEIAEIYPIIQELSEAYGLPFQFVGINSIDYFWNIAPEEKEQYLAGFLNNLGPGLHFFGGVHAALKNEETEVLQVEGSGYDANIHMAEHRQAVTDALISGNIMQIIEDRGIELVSFGDIFAPTPVEVNLGRKESFQVFPNPLDTSAIIDFEIILQKDVAISIYNSSGQKIANLLDGAVSAGKHQVVWEAMNFPDGVYFCEFQMDEYSVVKKVQIAR